jgi:membrane protein YqaA with SNARE-associated domain
MSTLSPTAYATQPHAGRALVALGALGGSYWPQGHVALLQALVLLHPERAFTFGLLATAGVAMGVAGGWTLGHVVGDFIVWRLPELAGWFGIPTLLQALPGLALAVLLALGFSPMPISVVAWLAGALALPLPLVVMGVGVGHGVRLLAHVWVLWRGGVRMAGWIARDWHGLTLVLSLLGLVGWLAAAYGWQVSQAPVPQTPSQFLVKQGDIQ